MGICSAFLGHYLELEHVRGASEVEVFRRVALLNQEKEELSQINETFIDQLNQEKADRKVEDAALLQERADHDITKVKSATDRYQFTTEAADSYDSGFNQALKIIKILYPEVDISVCDVLKEVVDGVLVVLIDGETAEDNAATGKQNGVGDDPATEIEKADAEVDDTRIEILEKDLRSAPCN
ncbi:hypothetical protein SESBI_29868 [Sesbania bispinosa]|nr:hypothetical protein SESBI_29868 [Sesbania bispinosa]